MLFPKATNNKGKQFNMKEPIILKMC